MFSTTTEKRYAYCLDCGVDTFVIKEWYMIRNELWGQVITNNDPTSQRFLCILCLEKRLGRKLHVSDFMDPAEAKINQPAPKRMSERLLDRLNAAR